MGRSNRLTIDGGVFHVTHRCHNQAFLLKFARDRDGYRRKLRETLPEFAVRLLDYTVTSNHVHLLADTLEKDQLSGLMRRTAGEFARSYNRRKDRSNAFWGDNFHATLVEDGKYLLECLLYIELNMVRCRAVEHPREWEWVGYHEIMGQRERYRLLDLDRLCWRLRSDSLAEVRQLIEAGIEERIARGEVKRMEHWTQALAVGSREFLEKSQKLIFSRSETEIVERGDNLFVLKEEAVPYNQETTMEIARKATLLT